MSTGGLRRLHDCALPSLVERPSFTIKWRQQLACPLAFCRLPFREFSHRRENACPGGFCVSNSSRSGENDTMRPTRHWTIQLLLVIATPLIAVTDIRHVDADDAQSLQLLVDALDSVDDANVLHALLQGMLKGLEGRRDVAAPENWSAAAAKLQTHNDARVRDLADQLSQIFGDQAAVQRALAVVRDGTARPAERMRQLTLLLEQQNQEASALLESLLDVPELQLAAIRGYASVANDSAPAVLLKQYPDMTSELRRAVVETLSTRKPYAEALLTAVENKTVPRDDVPTHVARSLHRLLGSRYLAVFGKPPTLGADREAQIARWKSRITADALDEANASRGRAVYQKTCAACHLLYGEGGKIGPDLTGSNRANLDYFLLNSVDPSYDVPAAYRMITIVTSDGRVINGVLAEEDGTRVILKTVENPRLVIAKADIEERTVSGKSMMPEGQLDALKLQQVLDLFKYLSTSEQVELPK
jgi:putative heme-binding domain-containing protein